MQSALIISSNEKATALIGSMLNEALITKIVTVNTAGEARRSLIDNEFDICIINAPLPDEYGEALAITIASKGIEVILLVKAEQLDEISYKVEDYGVFCVTKPVTPAFFWNALKLAKVAHKRMQNVKCENKKLIQKIEDIRIIDRAKCILIAYLSMSETEAHKYIERQAMDMRITRRAVAEEILKTYEN